MNTHEPWISATFFKENAAGPRPETHSQESSEERWLEERQAREAQVQGLEEPGVVAGDFVAIQA